MDPCKQCNGINFVEDKQRGDEICVECGMVNKCNMDLNWFQKYEYCNTEMKMCMQKCTQRCVKKNVFIQTEDDLEKLTKEAQSIQTHNPKFSELTCCVLSMCRNENVVIQHNICNVLKFPKERLYITKNATNLYKESIKSELQHICNVKNIMSKPFMQALRKREYKSYKNPKRMAEEIFHSVYYNECSS